MRTVFAIASAIFKFFAFANQIAKNKAAKLEFKKPVLIQRAANKVARLKKRLKNFNRRQARRKKRRDNKI